jgi:hypothetical protein
MEWMPSNVVDADFRLMVVVCGCVQAVALGLYLLVF